MKLFGKELDHEVAIIAEIGVNHEGNPDKAVELLELAADAGADAVKFQTYTPDRFISSDDPARLARVTRFGLDQETHRRLARVARDKGVTMFSAAISDDVIRFLAEEFPVIKIASGDLTFERMIRQALATGKPVIASTGLGTMDEIRQTVAWAEDEVGKDTVRDRLLLMHCVSAYPTPIEEANVRAVPYIAEQTGLRVGYSNHAIGPAACYGAVALGACMIEVHFTDNKFGRDFRDHELSCDPDDLKALVETLPRVRASLGSFSKNRQPSEAVVLAAMRKGLVAARDLTAGTVLAEEDLMFARPATEFGTGDLGLVIGKTMTVDKARGKTLLRQDVTE